MLGDFHFGPQQNVFQDQVYGPFDDMADGLYYAFQPGVTATIEGGGEMTDDYQPVVLGELTATNNLPDNTIAIMSWQAVSVNIGQMWVPAAPTRFTVKQAGLYHIGCEMKADPVAYAQLSMWAIVSGVIVSRLFKAITAAAAGSSMNGTASILYPLVVGDYLEFGVYQSSGAARGLLVGTRGQLRRVQSI